MTIIKLFVGIITWLIVQPINLTMTVLTVLSSPLLALFVYNSHGRERLIPPLHLLSTTDGNGGVDELWRGGYHKDYSFLKDKTVADFEGSAWLRYIARVLWIIRNPAYGIALDILGFTKDEGYDIISEGGRWDSGVTNWKLCVASNGPFCAFSFALQWHYSDSRYLRLWIGWKLDYPQKRVMLADHFNPMRPA